MTSMSKQPRKPLKWVGSAKRDLDAMPEDVKDVFGHAIDMAQAGGKHQYQENSDPCYPRSIISLRSLPNHN